jgi:hypothetical protein
MELEVTHTLDEPIWEHDVEYVRADVHLKRVAQGMEDRDNEALWAAHYKRERDEALYVRNEVADLLDYDEDSDEALLAILKNRLQGHDGAPRQRTDAERVAYVTTCMDNNLAYFDLKQFGPDIHHEFWWRGAGDEWHSEMLNCHVFAACYVPPILTDSVRSIIDAHMDKGPGR